MIESELYKYRGYAGCVKAATDLMCGKFKTIFKSTWMSVVALSLVCSVAAAYFSAPATVTTPVELLWTVVLPMLLASLLGLSSQAWLYGNLSNLQNTQGRRKNFFRSLRVLLSLGSIAVILCVALTWLCAAVQSAKASVGILALVTMASAIAAVVVFLPFVYASAKHLVTGTTPLKHVFTKDYREGWRHWGFLFVLMFVVTVIAVLVALFVMSPVMVLQMATLNNDACIMLGDSSALPGGFWLLNFVVSFIVQFVVAYVDVWVFFVFFYAYGTIEERRTAREQADKNIIMQ